MPRPRSRRITANSARTSSSSRLEVGSSRISTRADTPKARAIATICCTATGKPASGRSTSSSRSSSRSKARAPARTCFQSIRPNRVRG